MQGAIFSISNVLIQSSVNSFGSIAMAGNTASSNIEGFVYTAMNAVYQTNLSFTSQNLGGRKYSRINKIMYICLGVVTAVGLILGLTAVAAGDGLLHIYSSDPEVLHYGMLRLEIICTTYFLCGIMDCMVGKPERGWDIPLSPCLYPSQGHADSGCSGYLPYLRRTVPWTCCICPILSPGPSQPLPIW